MKHAICIAYTDISTNDKLIMLQCCIKSVKQYCNKYNIELSLVTKSKFNIGKHFGYNFGIWEKFQAAEDLDKYDRILCMDGDVLISPNAPNVFDIVPYNKIGAVYEDVGSRKQDRLRQIQLAQQQLGPTPNNWCQNYFNAGIMILSKPHKKAIELTQETIDLAFKKNWGPFKHQTLINWRVNVNEFKVHPLDYRFNHTSMFSEDWNNNANKLESFFIHYAGVQYDKVQEMQKDYKILFPLEEIK